MKNYLFASCIVLMVFQCLSQNEKKCAANGEYCQVHWDCCSNTCLTYSYICISQNQPPPIFNISEIISRFGENNANTPKPVSLEDIINNIFGPASANPLLQEPVVSSFSSDNASEILAIDKLTDSIRRPPVTNYTEQNTIVNRFNDESGINPEQTAVQNTVSGSQTSAANDTTTSEPCGEIGAVCFTHSTCCPPLLCHGYLHRCVT